MKSALVFLGDWILLLIMGVWAVASSVMSHAASEERRNPPITDETRAMIRRDMIDPAVCEARAQLAHDIHARHELGLDVTEMTLDELIGTNIVEVGEMQ